LEPNKFPLFMAVLWGTHV